MKDIYILLAALMFALPMCVSAQPVNAGFEQWTAPEGYDVPVGWYGDRLGMGKTSKAHGGTAAVQVWNWYYYSKGYLMSGPQKSSYFDLRAAGVPITWMPERLTGYYTFVPGQNNRPHDSAVVLVWLRRFNEGTQGADTLAFVRRTLAPAAEYTPFSIDLPNRMPGTMPDSIAIAFISSDSGFCTNESDGNCCYFSIDDIQLAASSGVSVDASSLFSGVQVYPNPVHAATFDVDVDVSGPAGRVRRLALYASDGRLVRDHAFTERSHATIDRAGLPAGTYLVELRDAAGRIVGRSRVVLQ